MIDAPASRPETAESLSEPLYMRGLQTLDSEMSVPALTVRGILPEWLTGSLLRIGPAKFEVGPDKYRHWFDGAGMIHKFTFAGGRAGYANRYVRGDNFLDGERLGRIASSGFATDPCGELFRKGFLHHHLTGNPSVNVISAGDVLMAMGESPLAIAIDPATLETGREWPWRDDILLDEHGYLRPQHTTAHPHIDRLTGEMVNSVAIFGRECRYELHRGPRDGSHRTRFATVPVDRPAYMHTFGMSENYVVLAEYPLVADVAALADRERPFIENYDWRPERGTVFTVVSKQDGRVVTRAQAEPFLGMHQINCFERDGEILFDVPAYPDSQHITQFYLDRRRASEALVASQVRRYTIPLDGRDAVGTLLFDENAELPAIDYPRDAERDYATAYAVAGRKDRLEGFYNQIVRFDLDHGDVERWFEDGCYPSEPVFVPAPTANDGAGLVLSIVLDGRCGRSFLLVLDAKTLSEIGRVETPHVIPFGFHGSYRPAEAC